MDCYLLMDMGYLRLKINDLGALEWLVLNIPESRLIFIRQIFCLAICLNTLHINSEFVHKLLSFDAAAAAVAAAVVAPIFGLGKLPVVVDVAAVATERCTSLQFCSSQLFKDDDDCGIQFFEWS